MEMDATGKWSRMQLVKTEERQEKKMGEVMMTDKA